MTDLPSRLSQGEHAVIFQERRGEPVQELKEEVDRRYVHVKFTGTRGGTEIGFPLDVEKSDLSGADWDGGAGSIHLEGDLKLDGVPARCIVDLDLATAEGRGHLQLR